jgi:hypothetical protein
MTHTTGIRRAATAFLLLVALYITAAVPSMAATLLPNGEQTFLDANGNPLAAGTVYFYIPNTSTPKNTYLDGGAVTPNANPVVLDSAGRAVIYGIGCYRQVVKNSAGVQQWDKTTCDTSTTEASWGGTASGTPNAIVVTADNFTGSDGQVIRFIAAANNTGATTINPTVAGVAFGAVTIMVDGGGGPVACSGGEIIRNNVVTLVYDANGGVFHLSTLTTITAGSGLSTSGTGAQGGTIAVSGTITSVEPVNAQTGTSYTLLTTDLAKLVSFNNSSSIAVTLPSANTTGFKAGFWFDLTNIGGGPVTLTPISGTINGAASLTVTSSNHGRVVSDGTNWLFAGNGGATAIGGSTSGYRKLSITNNTGTENTQIAITADYLSLADTNGFSFAVTSVNCVINYGATGSFSAGSGSFDGTGTFTTSTWYYHWVISNGSTTSCLGSASSSAPTMPAGYTFKMLVGANQTDGSTRFYRMLQKDSEVKYQIVAGTNTANSFSIITGNSGSPFLASLSWTAAAITGNTKCAPAIATHANVLGWIDQGSGTTPATIFAPNGSYTGYDDTTIAKPRPYIVPYNNVAASTNYGTLQVWVMLESSNIYYASNGTATGLFCIGFRLPL